MRDVSKSSTFFQKIEKMKCRPHLYFPLVRLCVKNEVFYSKLLIFYRSKKFQNLGGVRGVKWGKRGSKFPGNLVKKTGFRSANTPGDKRAKRGQNGVFLVPGGKFGQNSRKFPPGRPPPTAPGENPRIFRGEILGFSTVFGWIFPRKTGCFPRVTSPQNRGELHPPEPPGNFSWHVCCSAVLYEV